MPIQIQTIRILLWLSNPDGTLEGLKAPLDDLFKLYQQLLKNEEPLVIMAAFAESLRPFLDISAQGGYAAEVGCLRQWIADGVFLYSRRPVDE